MQLSQQNYRTNIQPQSMGTSNSFAATFGHCFLSLLFRPTRSWAHLDALLWETLGSSSAQPRCHVLGRQSRRLRKRALAYFGGTASPIMSDEPWRSFCTRSQEMEHKLTRHGACLPTGYRYRDIAGPYDSTDENILDHDRSMFRNDGS